MPIDVLPTVPKPPQAPAFTATESAEFEERWAAWQARGVARDSAVRRKAAVALPILITVGAVIIYVLLAR